MMLDIEGRNIRIFGFFGLVEEARQQVISIPTVTTSGSKP